jgi:hypothetical protein
MWSAGCFSQAKAAAAVVDATRAQLRVEAGRATCRRCISMRLDTSQVGAARKGGRPWLTAVSV